MSSSTTALSGFYAVSITGSVWFVSSKRQNGCPVVKRLFFQHRLPCKKNSVLANGTRIAISTGGIQLFTENQLSTQVSPGGQTGPIAAIFLNLDEAKDCCKSTDLRDWDPQWQAQTRETLRAIGSTHEVFVIMPDLELRVARYERTEP